VGDVVANHHSLAGNLADTCHSALLKYVPELEKREYSVKSKAESITYEKQ
jgi:hypothetical protein